MKKLFFIAVSMLLSTAAWAETIPATDSRITFVGRSVVEDGSYLRISNVSLSYQIPVPENKVVRGMSVGASARNCHVFTKYSGWDPEVNSYGSDMTRVGIDCGSYPSARTFCFDLKFTF